MITRSTVALALLVTLPLLLLAGLGDRLAREERERLSRTFDDLLRSRLAETETLLTGILDERRRALQQALEEEGGSSADRFDRLSRTSPYALQFFHQASDGAVLYPSIERGLTGDEREFLQRFGPVFDGKLLLIATEDRGPAAASSPSNAGSYQGFSLTKASRQTKDPAGLTEAGPAWFPWFWGNDVRLLFRLRLPDGSVGGAELSRPRLLADLIAAIPEASAQDLVLRQGAVSLVDGAGRLLFRWGGYSPPAGRAPRLRMPLAAPLQAWSLQYHAAPDLVRSVLGRGRAFGWYAGLLAVGIALSGLAFYLHRENQRELREAAQRVSFVNQVSHELKTPLTNIRLHAELLAGDLDDGEGEEGPGRKRLGVIVSESQRLGRLINNVLTFSRQQRDRIALNPAPAVPDALVGMVVDRFRPFLEGRGIRIELSLLATREVRIDADALEQILNNLLSNVEKYAAAGGVVFIATRQAGDETSLVVRDAGPGIPAAKAEFVFQPFARLNDSLTEGVAGAGIGLTLARELARKHGGELELVLSPDRLQDLANGPTLFTGVGACFRARLRTPPGEGTP